MVLLLTSKVYEILFKNLVRNFRIYDKDNKLLLLFYDVIISKTITKEVSVNYSSKVPTSPVENGGFINDSRVNEPTTISYTILIRAYEFEIANVVDKLEKLKSGIDLVKIVTPSKVHNNMALIDFSYPYENVKNFLSITMNFQEVVITKPQYFLIENPKDSINNKTKNVGKVQGENVNRKSLAKKLIGGKK